MTESIQWGLTKTGQKRVAVLTIDETEYRRHCDEYDGLCLACGAWTSGGCEPDARRRLCEECNHIFVYGAEEALMMGRIAFGEDA